MRAEESDIPLASGVRNAQLYLDETRRDRDEDSQQRRRFPRASPKRYSRVFPTIRTFLSVNRVRSQCERAETKASEREREKRKRDSSVKIYDPTSCPSVVKRAQLSME